MSLVHRTQGKTTRLRISYQDWPAWKRPWVWHLGTQAALLACVLLVGYLILQNIRINLPRSGLEIGVQFLSHPTRFEIGDNYLGATARDPVWMAFAVGLLNTIRVSIIGIILCTVLGTAVALARLSQNWLVTRVAFVYVETVRNIPLLLQMLFWYGFSTLFPRPGDAWQPLDSVFVTNRGVYFPSLVLDSGHFWSLAALALACLGILLALIGGRRYRERTGRRTSATRYAVAALLCIPIAVFLASGSGMTFSAPELKGFNFRGGALISPEFVAVVTALTVYQSGFAAETIRSGILGVKRGQIEAARSLGLAPARVLSLVVMPQALRIVIPPMTSQYLSLTKNSSLAVVIGYPELVRVSTAVISETGRAIECIAIIMAIYLMLSLITSAFMNWYNKKIAFVES